MHTITIYGYGCMTCVEALESVCDTLRDLRVDAHVNRITDISEITAMGILQMPAIAVDGEVKCAGRIPNRDELASWLMH